MPSPASWFLTAPPAAAQSGLPLSSFLSCSKPRFAHSSHSLPTALSPGSRVLPSPSALCYLGLALRGESRRAREGRLQRPARPLGQQTPVARSAVPGGVTCDPFWEMTATTNETDRQPATPGTWARAESVLGLLVVYQAAGASSGKGATVLCPPGRDSRGPGPSILWSQSTRPVGDGGTATRRPTRGTW